MPLSRELQPLEGNQQPAEWQHLNAQLLSWTSSDKLAADIQKVAAVHAAKAAAAIHGTQATAAEAVAACTAAERLAALGRSSMAG